MFRQREADRQGRGRGDRKGDVRRWLSHQGSVETKEVLQCPCSFWNWFFLKRMKSRTHLAPTSLDDSEVRSFVHGRKLSVVCSLHGIVGKLWRKSKQSGFAALQHRSGSGDAVVLCLPGANHLSLCEHEWEGVSSRPWVYFAKTR